MNVYEIRQEATRIFLGMMINDSKTPDEVKKAAQVILDHIDEQVAKLLERIKKSSS
jgi:hypothetical protein